MTASNIVDLSDPTANMYGCQPCPKCKSKYRCVFQTNADEITCDDCGFKEKIAENRNNTDA